MDSFLAEYCPLDLFSGQIHRMKRAMANLYKDPHNRFKMFKNGCWLMAQNFGQKSQVEQELAKWMGLDVDSQINGDDVINKLSSMVCTALLATNFISGKLKMFFSYIFTSWPLFFSAFQWSDPISFRSRFFAGFISKACFVLERSFYFTISS